MGRGKNHKYDESHICIACGHSEGWVENWRAFECIPEVGPLPQKPEGTMDKEGRYTAGAMRAAREVNRGAMNGDRQNYEMNLDLAAEIISRETSDKEMADLLREFEQLLIGPDERKRMSDLQERAEALLTKIGETP